MNGFGFKMRVRTNKTDCNKNVNTVEHEYNGNTKLNDERVGDNSF